jgi:hypothetical protein
MTEFTMTPSFYWDLSDIPQFVKTELSRRANSNSGKFSHQIGVTESSKYTHPLSSWSRVCSNTSANGKDGFILTGAEGTGFLKAYGLGGLSGTVIGYTPTGDKHIIPDERYKHRPPPGILSIDTELSGGDGKFRITTIKWLCWSLDQLHYMTPYFLTNGVSMSVEFGWNTINTESLLPLSDETSLLKYFFNEDPKFSILELVKKSYGNYDAAMGIVSDFDAKIRSDGGFDCTTVIKNVGGFFSGVYSTSKTSSETDSPTSQVEEIKTYIKKLFNDTPELARKYHNGLTPAPIRYSRTGGKIYSSNQTYHKGSIIGQVFYGRNSAGSPSGRIQQGKPRDYDFDKNSDNWWISMGYFIRILNSKCSVKSGDWDLFKINIDNSVISAHPNLISNNGNVLLIPNQTTPQILIQDVQNDVPLPESIIDKPTGDVDIDEANRILLEKGKFFYKTGNIVKVTRHDVNAILNWFDPIGKNAFPTPPSTDDPNIKGKYSGYLRNLYISKDVIINAVESANTFRSILMNVLEQVSKAAGDIWDFDIVPLKPDGHDNGTMTVIDKNSINGYTAKKLFDFEINTTKGMVKGIDFAFKSTDAVTVQTLFGGGDDVQNYVSQDFKVPLPFKKSDRLIKKLSPAEKTDVEINQEQEDEAKRKILGNERIPTKESSKFFFYTKSNKITYMLAEPNEEIQKGLILSGDKSPLRYSCVQPGITLELTVSGISGMVNLNTFTVSELPSPYGDRCFFQVQNIKHSVKSGNWETRITAGVRLKPEFAGR